MKRGTGFRPKLPPLRPVKQYEVHTPRLRPMAVPVAPAANAATFRPAPKDRPLQHGGYIAAVRRLACAHCCRPGPSQFCHADILGTGGKGKGIKSDCRLGWPGCADTSGREGCHTLIGSRGTYTKADRHALEARYGTETRATVRAMGAWPARLPAWPGDTDARQA